MNETNNDSQLEQSDVFNRQLVQAIQDAPDGHLKNASESSSRMVRRRIRENGFGRLILPFKPVTDADLNQLPNTELPVIIEEMEPESPGAKAISFNDTADTAFYRGDKFVVYFCKIATPEFTVQSVTCDRFDRDEEILCLSCVRRLGIDGWGRLPRVDVVTPLCLMRTVELMSDLCQQSS